MKRPLPPKNLWRDGSLIVPAPELTTWIRDSFIEGYGRLVNPEHNHLKFAFIGCLWTNVPNRRNMNSVVGQTEIPGSKGGAWQKARHELQMREWFGPRAGHLNFLLTFYAPYWLDVDNTSACALSEHELYHCGQARDQWGCLKFTKQGKPVFGLRGHDVEEFVGVVARYGIGAAAGRSRAFLEAANRRPLIGAADVASVCGNCLAKVA